MGVAPQLANNLIVADVNQPVHLAGEGLLEGVLTTKSITGLKKPSGLTNIYVKEVISLSLATKDGAVDVS